MPLHQLAVAPADVSGSRLTLALNAAAPKPLATYRLTHPVGGALLLGVLGASHVVAVEHSGHRFSEQISCSAGNSLPQRSHAPGYQLKSTVEERDEATFRALAKLLRERCAREPGWLGGVFPGDDAALTALTAAPDGTGWCWQTWHLYPTQSGGTVVHTASRWHP
ncbi:hypothetical protein A5634_04785 [Mycobacterium asiaticum]|uniref:DUF2617 domain-containing protein n=1 Tax=Mycobacterium asiaticum TaxID=1790 RepID=A0A1A3NPS1_MYCAS|nr:DUF2617 family protein [Mycobacterium asiaticum]OBK23876.1 hypothetical protein A5634_04785 [Mycobacterium asiaticum]